MDVITQYGDITVSHSKNDSRPSLLDSLAHSAVFRAVQAISKYVNDTEPMYCIDATAGNGHDTCFLASLGMVGTSLFAQQNYFVLACDVQEEALQNTQERLNAYGLQAELVHVGHEKIAAYLPEKSIVAGVLFNLGYLPKKERNADFVVTKADTTLQALISLSERLCPQGVICVHCYTGHAGGMEEYQAVHDFMTKLEPKLWRVLSVSDINRSHNLEYLFLLEKLQIKQKRAVC